MNWRLVSPIACWCHLLPLPGPTSPPVSSPPPPGASAHAATTPTTVMTPSPWRTHLFKPAAPPHVGAPSSSAAITAVAPSSPLHSLLEPSNHPGASPRTPLKLVPQHVALPHPNSNRNLGSRVRAATAPPSLAGDTSGLTSTRIGAW
jgi:hypothetical protein